MITMIMIITIMNLLMMVVVVMMNLVTRGSHHYHCLCSACGSKRPQIALNTYSN